MILALLLAAGAAAAPARVDQLAYVKLLRANRPDLWGSAATCKDNLIVRPAYRERVLSGSLDFAALLRAEYSSAQQSADKAWADAHRAAMKENAPVLEKKGSIVRAAGYNPEYFVGYKMRRVKEANVASLEGGYQHKLYLEFDDPSAALTPQAYLAFSEALASAGYEGDSKVQLYPGTARFKFNNLVLHARTRADALTAERVALSFFAGKLAGHGRGLDVAVGPGDDDWLDWSQYLCFGDLTRLPPDARRFLSYED